MTCLAPHDKISQVQVHSQLAVYLDLETTGLRPRQGPEVAQILQLGAVTVVGGGHHNQLTSVTGGRQVLFNTYMQPSKAIDPDASEVSRVVSTALRIACFVNGSILLFVLVKGRKYGHGQAYLTHVTWKNISVIICHMIRMEADIEVNHAYIVLGRK